MFLSAFPSTLKFPFQPNLSTAFQSDFKNRYVSVKSKTFPIYHLKNVLDLAEPAAMMFSVSVILSLTALYNDAGMTNNACTMFMLSNRENGGKVL